MLKRMVLCTLIIGSYAQAQMYYNDCTKTYYTYPASPEIDQNQYNKCVQFIVGNFEEMAAMKRPYTIEYMWGFACGMAMMEYSKEENETFDRFQDDLMEIISFSQFQRLLLYPRR